MPRYSFIGLFSLFLVSNLNYAANIRLKIEGLSGDLEQNVRIRLSSITTEEIRNDIQFQERINEAISQGLRALGYYHPIIKFKMDNRSILLHPMLIAKINKGKPVRIAGENIILKGSALTDEEFLNLVNKHRPTIGEILNHGKYDRFKKALTNLALRKGYFDADMIKSQLSVAKDIYKAFWDIEFNSGLRYRFGEIKFKGSQIRTEYLQNIVPFHQRDYYRSEDLAELNRCLSATNWFNSIIVSPDFKKSKKNIVLPIDVWVTPSPCNTIETGIGYSTDFGLRVKGSWKKPWINNRGHSLATSASISASEQQLALNYKIPLLNNPLKQYYVLQGSFKHINLNETNSATSKVLISRNWNISNGWQRTLNLTWRFDHFTQNFITKTTTMLLYSGVSLDRTRSRGGLMPTWGDSQRYSIDVSNTNWGSRINFALLQAQNVWIRTLENKHRFIAHWQIGWIKTNDLEKIPLDLRLFTGGDHTILGYKYKGIASHDKNDKLIGASKMLIGSLEYQYNVIGKWWGALFIDSRKAFNNIQQVNMKTDTGIGVHWQSPVGAIKIGIILPLGDQNSHGLKLYIGLGPEL